jgi:hypothetical protein
MDDEAAMNFYWLFGILIVAALLFGLYAGNRRPKR